MGSEPPAEPRRLSRAAVLKRAGALGAAATLPASVTSTEEASASLHAVVALTRLEFETLTSITARLVPTDATGPGAVEARASIQIDRALNSHYSYQRDTYTTNLAAINAYSSATFGSRFTSLAPALQDQVLTAMERNTVPASFGFSPNALTFFNLVLAHTQEGMFSDPYYGGNANFVGWDLLGFPGVKLEYMPSEQRLNARIVPAHRSTYSYSLFKGGGA